MYRTNFITKGCEDMRFTLVFIRHGETEANKRHVISGHFDTQLTQEGREELHSLRKQLTYPETEMHFSSDLSRAMETFEILYSPKQLDRTLSEFRETFFGQFEHQPIHEAIEIFYDAFLNNNNVFEIETYNQLKNRVSKGIDIVLQDLWENKKSSATIVCHNGVIRMIHHLLTDSPLAKYRDVTIPNGQGLIVTLEVNEFLDILSKTCTFFEA